MDIKEFLKKSKNTNLEILNIKTINFRFGLLDFMINPVAFAIFYISTPKHYLPLLSLAYDGVDAKYILKFLFIIEIKFGKIENKINTELKTVEAWWEDETIESLYFRCPNCGSTLDKHSVNIYDGELYKGSAICCWCGEEYQLIIKEQ